MNRLVAIFQVCTVLMFGLFPALTLSQESHGLEPADVEALQKTIELLVNKEQREAAITGDADAQSAHQKVKDLGGGAEGEQQIYELAAKIFKDLVISSGGDVGKMNELVKNAKSNPKAFAQKLTPEQRAQLKALADKLSQVPSSQH